MITIPWDVPPSLKVLPTKRYVIFCDASRGFFIAGRGGDNPRDCLK